MSGSDAVWPDGAREAVNRTAWNCFCPTCKEKVGAVLTALEPFVQQRIAAEVARLREAGEHRKPKSSKALGEPYPTICGNCGLPGALDLDLGGTYHKSKAECIAAMQAENERLEELLRQISNQIFSEGMG